MGAVIIRIGFGCRLYCNFNKEPPKIVWVIMLAPLVVRGFGSEGKQANRSRGLSCSWTSIGRDLKHPLFACIITATLRHATYLHARPRTLIRKCIPPPSPVPTDKRGSARCSEGSTNPRAQEEAPQFRGEVSGPYITKTTLLHQALRKT